MTAPAPTKITFLIDSMEARAGMERVTATVASGLAQRGLQIQILTRHGDVSAFPLDPAVKLTSLHMPPGSLRMRSETLPLIRQLRREFRAWQPDLLIAVDTFLSAFAFPAALGLNIRRVAWEHFHFHTSLNMRSRHLGRLAAAFLGHQVVTLTTEDAGQWRRAFPQAPARIQAIANPLSFEQRPDNPYAPDRSTVLAVGRLDDQKGFDLLLRAWAEVEATVPGWSLRILGNGAQERALRELGAKLGLKRWNIEPATDRIEQEYLAAGIYALSSRHEGLPMVLMESQAYGVPAVAFNCPTGPADLLGPGGGILVEAGQITQFAQALQKLMSDPQARLRLSAEAFHNSARYEAERILDEWTELVATLHRPPGRAKVTQQRLPIGR